MGYCFSVGEGDWFVDHTLKKMDCGFSGAFFDGGGGGQAEEPLEMGFALSTCLERCMHQGY